MHEKRIRGPFCVHWWLSFEKYSFFKIFIFWTRPRRKRKSLLMKTRIIFQLLIAREKDTWAILCTLIIIVWKVFVIKYVFAFLHFLNLLQKSLSKNYLSVINCTKNGYMDHFVYIDDCLLKSICNWICIRFFRFPELTPEIFQIDEIKN